MVRSKRCLDDVGWVRWMVWSEGGIGIKVVIGGCVVWVLLCVLLSRFKALSISYPGGRLT